VARVGPAETRAREGVCSGGAIDNTNSVGHWRGYLGWPPFHNIWSGGYLSKWSVGLAGNGAIAGVGGASGVGGIGGDAADDVGAPAGQGNNGGTGGGGGAARRRRRDCNTGTLTISTGSTFTSNTAAAGAWRGRCAAGGAGGLMTDESVSGFGGNGGTGGDGGPAAGGAIENLNTITLYNATFRSNAALGGAGGSRRRGHRYQRLDRRRRWRWRRCHRWRNRQHHVADALYLFLHF